jgi:hypothetical protein
MKVFATLGLMVLVGVSQASVPAVKEDETSTHPYFLKIDTHVFPDQEAVCQFITTIPTAGHRVLFAYGFLPKQHRLTLLNSLLFKKFFDAWEDDFKWEFLFKCDPLELKDSILYTQLGEDTLNYSFYFKEQAPDLDVLKLCQQNHQLMRMLSNRLNRVENAPVEEKDPCMHSLIPIRIVSPCSQEEEQDPAHSYEREKRLLKKVVEYSWDPLASGDEGFLKDLLKKHAPLAQADPQASLKDLVMSLKSKLTSELEIYKKTVETVDGMVAQMEQFTPADAFQAASILKDKYRVVKMSFYMTVASQTLVEILEDMLQEKDLHWADYTQLSGLLADTKRVDEVFKKAHPLQ